MVHHCEFVSSLVVCMLSGYAIIVNAITINISEYEKCASKHLYDNPTKNTLFTIIMMNTIYVNYCIFNHLFSDIIFPNKHGFMHWNVMLQLYHHFIVEQKLNALHTLLISINFIIMHIIAKLICNVHYCIIAILSVVTLVCY